MRLIKLELSTAEWEQVNDDITAARDELREVSRDLDYFCTDLDDRLDSCISILRGAIR